MKDTGLATVADAAQEYAARGWHVFPVPPGTKESHKSAKYSGSRAWGATTRPDEIARDWARWPEANVGIVCGPKSGVLVIEADTADGHGVDGIGNLAELIRLNGELPDTIEAESPSGSRHIYFKWPEGEKILNSTSQVAPGVDVRGDGGMVVGVPSVKGDASYRWLNPPGFFELSDCPEWLLARCRKPEPRPEFKIDLGPSDYEGGDADRDVAEIEEALSYIDPDGLGYQGWVDILMALHAELGASGEAVAERWSARGAKFKPDDVSKRWGGFKPGGGIGIETVFARAKQNGCAQRAAAEASEDGIVRRRAVQEER
jgi:putative DNA primase/helicase